VVCFSGDIIVNVNVPQASPPTIEITVPEAVPPSVEVTIPNTMDININRSANEVSLTDKLLLNMDSKVPLTIKELEHITYETTEQSFDNIGKDMPTTTPQSIRATRDAVQAKHLSDDNTFELDSSDLDDLYDNEFDDANLSSIFKFLSKTERITAVNSGTPRTY